MNRSTHKPPSLTPGRAAGKSVIKSSGNADLAALVASRVQQSAAVSQPGIGELTWPCLLLRIGSRWCGVHAESVRVVVSPESITRVPAQPGHVLGVSMVHGRLVPVMDLGQLLTGMDLKLEAPPGRRLVVLVSQDIEIGIVADDAKGVIYLPALTESQPGAGRPDYIVGEVRWEQHLICLLDHEGLIKAATGVDRL